MSLLLFAALAVAEPARYGLVIGANRGSGDDVPLRFAEQDAGRVADVLRSLGDIDPANLVVLRGANSADVRHALATLSRRIAAESTDESSLIVYYSGHADEGNLHLEGTELPLSEVRALVSAVPAKLRVVVLDACQSAAFMQRKGGTPVAAFKIVQPEQTLAEGLAVLTAGAAGEDAQESERLQGGVFTHHLVVGLSGAADTSGDRKVTLDEAYRYAYARTLSTTSLAPVVQHPSYSFDLRGQADVVLTTLDDPDHAGLLQLTDAGVYVIFDGNVSRLVAEAEVPAGGFVALAPGDYRVRKRLPDRVYELGVVVRTGSTTPLATKEMRVQPYGQVARRGSSSGDHVGIGIIAGGGVSTPLLDGYELGPTALAGIRTDLPWLTLMVRATYGVQEAENEYLSGEATMIAAEVAAVRLFEVGIVGAGLGIVGGAEWVSQSYITVGEAPDRAAFGGRVGPVARVEVALAPRLSLGVEGTVDIHFLPVSAAGDVDLLAAPRGSADLTLWVR